MISQFISKSLLLRFLFIMIVFGIISVVTLLLIQRQIIIHTGMNEFAEVNTKLSTKFVDTVYEPMLYSRIDLVEAEYDKQHTLPESVLHGVIVIDAAKKIILRKGDTDHLQYIESEIASHPDYFEKSTAGSHGQNEYLTFSTVVDKNTNQPIGYIALAWNNEQVQAKAQDQTLVNSIFILLMVIFNISVVLIIMRIIILSPLKRIQQQMSALSAGDVETNVAYTDRGDEIGQMAQALLVFKDNLLSNIKLSDEQKDRIRTEQIRKETLNHLASMFAQKMQTIVSTVASASNQLERTAEYVNNNIDKSVNTISHTEHDARETSRGLS